MHFRLKTNIDFFKLNEKSQNNCYLGIYFYLVYFRASIYFISEVPKSICIICIKKQHMNHFKIH